jgi:glutathione transport system permease protein
VRGNTLQLKNLTYIEAARSIGASDHHHVGTSSPAPSRPSWCISPCASAPPSSPPPACPSSAWARNRPRPSGADAERSPRRHGDRAARGAGPSLAIFLTVLAFNLLGDGLRDALDPKIDQR